VFNKWKALEEALDYYGRVGWICLMDADVLWPKGLRIFDSMGGVSIVGWDGNERVLTIESANGVVHLRRSQLCTPMRRMWEEWPSTAQLQPKTRFDPDTIIPAEEDWSLFPLHPQQREFAGYSQIFHANDPHLGSTPWHEIDWRHAGGADSFFQAKWPDECKVRPPFEVLHLGPAGKNWCGRATPYADGTTHADAATRQEQVRAFIRGRVHGSDRFKGEKL
jgi:hypothetical protein